jgi:hypothetical protein
MGPTAEKKMLSPGRRLGLSMAHGENIYWTAPMWKDFL